LGKKKRGGKQSPVRRHEASRERGGRGKNAAFV